MTKMTALSEILSRLGDDSTGRSQCLVPLDDDWKDRMRALAQNDKTAGKLPDPAQQGDQSGEGSTDS